MDSKSSRNQEIRPIADFKDRAIPLGDVTPDHAQPTATQSVNQVIHPFAAFREKAASFANADLADDDEKKREPAGFVSGSEVPGVVPVEWNESRIELATDIFVAVVFHQLKTNTPIAISSSYTQEGDGMQALRKAINIFIRERDRDLFPIGGRKSRYVQNLAGLMVDLARPGNIFATNAWCIAIPLGDLLLRRKGYQQNVTSGTWHEEAEALSIEEREVGIRLQHVIQKHWKYVSRKHRSFNKPDPFQELRDWAKQKACKNRVLLKAAQDVFLNHAPIEASFFIA